MVNQKIALVIDDDPDIVQSVKDILREELQYLVLAATDPETAVELAKIYLFDILILDLHMPRLDGFQVLEMVRKNQPRVKVLVLTGLYDQYKERFKHAKVDKIIEKPIEPPQFQRDIIELAGAVDGTPEDLETGIIPKAKIMLVDDEKEQCEYLKDFILEDKPNSYEVEIATRGEEAIVKNNEFEPDIMMFDIKMPHLKGDEMLNIIQESSGHKPRLFVVLSAVAFPETVQEMEKKGCFYITKPYRIEEVLKFLRRKCLDLGLAQEVSE